MKLRFPPNMGRAMDRVQLRNLIITKYSLDRVDHPVVDEQMRDFYLWRCRQV